MPSRGVAAVQAVTRTKVSPDRTITAPSACLAKRPVSIEMVRLPTEISRVCMSVFLSCELRQLLAVRLIRFQARLASPVTWQFCQGPKPAAMRLLLPNTEPLDQLGVAIRILTLQVVQQASPLTDQLQKAAARVMIFRVGLE